VRDACVVCKAHADWLCWRCKRPLCKFHDVEGGGWCPECNASMHKAKE
jgi:hypothetical protein